MEQLSLSIERRSRTWSYIHWTQNINCRSKNRCYWTRYRDNTERGNLLIGHWTVNVEQGTFVLNWMLKRKVQLFLIMNSCLRIGSRIYLTEHLTWLLNMENRRFWTRNSHILTRTTGCRAKSRPNSPRAGSHSSWRTIRKLSRFQKRPAPFEFYQNYPEALDFDLHIKLSARDHAFCAGLMIITVLRIRTTSRIIIILYGHLFCQTILSYVYCRTCKVSLLWIMVSNLLW